MDSVLINQLSSGSFLRFNIRNDPSRWFSVFLIWYSNDYRINFVLLRCFFFFFCFKGYSASLMRIDWQVRDFDNGNNGKARGKSILTFARLIGAFCLIYARHRQRRDFIKSFRILREILIRPKFISRHLRKRDQAERRIIENLKLERSALIVALQCYYYFVLPFFLIFIYFIIT